MELNDTQQTIVRLIAVGRDSLDHFVDTLQIDCQVAREIAESMVMRGHINRVGDTFVHMLTYRLNENSRKMAEYLLEQRSSMAKRLNILDDEWSVLIRLSEHPKSRSKLETETPDIPAGAMQSVLAHLVELGLVRLSGFIQVYVRLSPEAKIKLADSSLA